jgi:prevent-host-death family protein
MVKTVSLDEARAQLDTIIEALRDADARVLIEERGRAAAVLIAPAEYERLAELDGERDWRGLDALAERNADKDPDAAFAEITAEIEAYRQERRRG